jgi:hypothetical protein
MFRKSTLAVAAVTMITAAALVPTNAFAGGGGGKGGGGGWGGKGGGFNHHHWGYGGLFLSTAVASSCWQWVETRRGLVRVYVCD